MGIVRVVTLWNHVQTSQIRSIGSEMQRDYDLLSNPQLEVVELLQEQDDEEQEINLFEV